MATENTDDYFVYDTRLASFYAPQVVAKRRTSSAHSRAPKVLSWPHKSIKPTDMAKAGFIFQPLPSNPDNVSCFLCNKALDGWEEDDNPLEEHLRHSPECGWAITAAVEAELGEYAREDPRDALMREARTATFADRWPHENRKGWGCKTKQLVEAGWKYTPTLDSDDMATCTYCQLAVDGWEKSDNPWDEHYSRTPDCPFFSLISSRPAPKAGGSKAARRSKASRLSIQSLATLASDLTSVTDVTADIDDSELTTASSMAAASQGAKKTAKGRKTATTARARKTRAKKDEAVEVTEDELAQEAAVPPPPPELTQSRKRTSDEVEDSVMTNTEAPAPKKRATKTPKVRDSSAMEVSQADTDMLDVPEPAKKPAAKRTTRQASKTRKASGDKAARMTSEASIPSAALAEIPDDAEIERKLQADLDRPLTDDEDISADPETEKAAASRKKQVAMQTSDQDELLAHTATTGFSMFDPALAQPTDVQIDAALKSIEGEMDADRKEDTEEIKVPKKGRKAGARKVSKQATTTKEPAAPVEQPHPPAAAEAEEPDEIAEADVSFRSAGTGVKKSLGRTSLGSVASNVSNTSTKSTGKRGRPAKKSKLSQDTGVDPTVLPAAAEPAAEPAPEPIKVDAEPAPAPVAEVKRTSTGKRGRPPKKSKTSDVAPMPAPEEPAPVKAPAEVEVEVEAEPALVQTEVRDEMVTIQESLPAVASASTPKITRKPVPAPKDSPFAIRKDGPSIVPSGSQILPVPPHTPRHQASPQSAKQATVSPSPSPQASDAENRPPSSQPNTASGRSKRLPLALLPVQATPMRQTSPSKGLSPSRQNVISGLQSTKPWTAADVDLVFEGYYNGQEHEGAADRFFARGGELTDRERDMTVEEWIYHNAGRAEQKLKLECETMVMAFEREGTRAMGTLEGLVVD